MCLGDVIPATGHFTGGVDLFKNLTPNLNASITVNTDFAETEADIRQVNLTGFHCSFPEKRASSSKAPASSTSRGSTTHGPHSVFQRAGSASSAMNDIGGGRCRLARASR